MLEFTGLVISVLLVSEGVIVSGYDNWGKKVPCFLVEQTVICPGCNQRAGLTCPRKLKESRNCLVSTTEAPYRSTIKYPNPAETTAYEEMNTAETTILPSSSKTSYKSTIKYPNPAETTAYKEMNATETTLISSSQSQKPTESNEILSRAAKNPMDIALYLHRLLGSNVPRNRYAREAAQEKLVQEEVDDDEESCNWNGDCPCPLICCKTGPGCPKKCVTGIQLPPPWG